MVDPLKEKREKKRVGIRSFAPTVAPAQGTPPPRTTPVTRQMPNTQAGAGTSDPSLSYRDQVNDIVQRHGAENVFGDRTPAAMQDVGRMMMPMNIRGTDVSYSDPVAMQNEYASQEEALKGKSVARIVADREFGMEQGKAESENIMNRAHARLFDAEAKLATRTPGKNSGKNGKGVTSEYDKLQDIKQYALDAAKAEVGDLPDIDENTFRKVLNRHTLNGLAAHYGGRVRYNSRLKKNYVVLPDGTCIDENGQKISIKKHKSKTPPGGQEKDPPDGQKDDPSTSQDEIVDSGRSLPVTPQVPSPHGAKVQERVLGASPSDTGNYVGPFKFNADQYETFPEKIKGKLGTLRDKMYPHGIPPWLQ